MNSFDRNMDNLRNLLLQVDDQLRQCLNRVSDQAHNDNPGGIRQAIEEAISILQKIGDLAKQAEETIRIGVQK